MEQERCRLGFVNSCAGVLVYFCRCRGLIFFALILDEVSGQRLVELRILPLESWCGVMISCALVE